MITIDIYWLCAYWFIVSLGTLVYLKLGFIKFDNSLDEGITLVLLPVMMPMIWFPFLCFWSFEQLANYIAKQVKKWLQLKEKDDD